MTHRDITARFGPLVSRSAAVVMRRRAAASVLCQALGLLLEDTDLRDLGVLHPPQGQDRRLAQRPAMPGE